MPVVHPVAEAVLEDGAGGTLAATGPGPVTEGVEAFLPDIPQTVGIDISLGKRVPVDIRTGADAAVNQYGSDVDACVAEIRRLADLLLVAAEVAFATEGDVHPA